MALVTFYMNLSAVGDAVCCLPTVKALIADKKLYKVLVPKRFVELVRICGIPEEYIVEATREDAVAFDANGSEKIQANIPGHAAYRIHLVDLFSIFPLNAVLKPEEKCIQAVPKLLPKIKPPAKGPYVVIGIGYAQKSRRLPVKAYNKIVENCKKRGYSVVLLGASRAPDSKQPIHFEDHPKEGCIDLIDKTTIPESIAIMAKASCVIGVDSGLIYLASLTNVPIVCGYTFVEGYYRIPYRHGEKGWNFYPIEPRGECKCCSSELAMFGVEFDTDCPKGMGYECSATLDGADFVSALRCFLRKRIAK